MRRGGAYPAFRRRLPDVLTAAAAASCGGCGGGFSGRGGRRRFPGKVNFFLFLFSEAPEISRKKMS